MNIKQKKKLEDKFFQAIKNQNIEELKKIIELGIDINCIDKNGHTGLHRGSLNGYISVANLLIEKKADVNFIAQDEIGSTPLMLAILSKYKEIVDTLIKAGANVNLKTLQGDTALILASFAGESNIIYSLLKAGANVNVLGLLATPLMLAILSGDYESVRLLIEYGADFNARDRKGMSVLGHVLSSKENYNSKILYLLIESGIDIDEKDQDGVTLLMVSSRIGFYDISDKLIKFGANIDIVSDKKVTAYKVAFTAQNFDIIKLLENAPLKRKEIKSLKFDLFDILKSSNSSQDNLNKLKKIMQKLTFYVFDANKNNPLHFAIDLPEITDEQITLKKEIIALILVARKDLISKKNKFGCNPIEYAASKIISKKEESKNSALKIFFEIANQERIIKDLPEQKIEIKEKKDKNCNLM